MNHRPYPRADRARAQIERHATPPACPLCDHLVTVHATANGIATCGPSGHPNSCLDCVKTWTAMPALQGMAELGRALQHAPHLVVLTGRQAGHAPGLILPCDHRRDPAGWLRNRAEAIHTGEQP